MAVDLELTAPAPAARPAGGADADLRERPVYHLYRKLRRIVSLQRFRDVRSAARAMLEELVEAGAGATQPAGGRLYARRGELFVVEEEIGASAPIPLPRALAAADPPARRLFEQGWLIGQPTAAERAAGGADFAGVALGPDRGHLLFFSLPAPVVGPEIAAALASLASVADLALRQGGLLHAMEQAREVQTSLLPAALPELPGFDLAVASQAARMVGGDVYDCRALPSRALALAVADATGHGLPAALQARDAIVGLRVGIEADLEPAASIETLDRVLRAGSPRGRFISLFYGELDAGGALAYVNAGHPPGLLARADGGEVERLASTGPLLGLPLPRAFAPAEARVEPGDLLLLYTDGITEARSASEEEFGSERLAALAGDCARAGRGARDTVERILVAVEAFAAGTLQTDDRTLLALRRL